jgi:hypothetical protein
MNMFPVKRVLKKLYDVLSDSVLCGETFGPSEENARIEGGLFHREGEGEGQGNIWTVPIGVRYVRVGTLGGCVREESVHGVGEIV